MKCSPFLRPSRRGVYPTKQLVPTVGMAVVLVCQLALSLPVSALAQSVCSKRSAPAIAVYVETQLDVLAPQAAVYEGSKVQVWGLAETVTVTEDCAVSITPLSAPRWRIEGPPGSGVTLEGTGLQRSFVPRMRGDYLITLSAAGSTARTLVTAVGSWVSIGPDHSGSGRANIAGRVYDLAADPTDPGHLFAASPNGGLWEGFEHGGRWRPLLDETAPQTTPALAVDPGPPLRVYAATGHRLSASYMARGVLRATRDRNRWEWTLLAPDLLGNAGPNAPDSVCCKSNYCSGETDPRMGTVVNDIALKLAPKVIFAATNHGIYRCLDGEGCADAQAWDLLGAGRQIDGGAVLGRLPGGGDRDVQQLEVVPATATDPDRPAMLIASLSGEGVFTSVDGGDIWEAHAEDLPQPLDSSGRKKTYEVALSADEPTVLFAAYGRENAAGTTERRLFRSENRQPWRQVRFPGNGGDTAICEDSDGVRRRKVMHMAVVPDDPNQLMLAHVYKVRWVTVDNSDPARPTATCSENDDFDHPNDGRDRQVLFFSPNWAEDRRMYYGSDGGVFSARDGEATFQERTDGMVNTEFADLATSYSSDVLAYGGMQDNGIAYRMWARTWLWKGAADNYQSGLDPGDAFTVYDAKRSTYRRKVQLSWRQQPWVSSPATQIRVGRQRPIFTTFTPGELILLEGGRALLFGMGQDATSATEAELQNLNNWVDITPPGAAGDVTVVAATRSDENRRRRFYAGTERGELFSGLADVQGEPVWDPQPLLGFDCNRPVNSVAFDKNLASPERLFVVCADVETGSVFEVSPQDGVCNVTGNLADDPAAGDPSSRRLTNCVSLGDERVTTVVDPASPGHLFVASQEGIVEGFRRGPCDIGWFDSVGVPHTTVTALTASPEGAKAVRAATHGRGAFEWVPPRLPRRCDFLGSQPCLEVGQTVDPALVRPSCLFEGSSGCALTWLGSYPVDYYTGSETAELAVQAIPPEVGASAFITPPVPIPAGRGVAFVHLLYARSDAPAELRVPALRFRLLERSGNTTLLEKKVPFGRSFRSADGRYLAVRTNGRPPDSGRTRLEVPIRITTSEGPRKETGPELLEVLPAGSNVKLEAPESFTDENGAWRLAGWWDGAKLSPGPRFTLILEEDRALEAIYYLRE